MKTALLDGWTRLDALAGEWNALLARSRSDRIFLTWEWIQAWRSIVGDLVRPLVVVARDGAGALAGIGPFYTMGLKLAGVLPYRSLRTLGDYHTGAECLDWIARQDVEAEAMAAIAAALRDAGGWDCLWMPYVAHYDGARDRIAAACASAGFYLHERPCEFGRVDLPATLEAYEKSLSSGFRNEVRKRRRDTFEKAGATLVRCATEAEREPLLEALFDLNHRRWSERGITGTFVRKPFEARFYHEFTRTALERGWLRLAAVKVGDAVKAVQIGYVYKKTFYSLQEGFDPEGPPGVGNALRIKVIEACIAEGVTTYDFLGEVTEHKIRWQAKRCEGR
ncbi:MAG TPA: GNAT family N-acetyltransferase, partial [Planctomycetota bacterium]|nr:GNAT family N-acetyltransferase [Planctomycetota bacterium]